MVALEWDLANWFICWCVLVEALLYCYKAAKGHQECAVEGLSRIQESANNWLKAFKLIGRVAV
jgi:hypothetical protein